MSGSVLAAVVDPSVLARLSPEQCQRLASIIDAELLSDPTVRARLVAVVRAAADRLVECPDASQRGDGSLPLRDR
jgi:hypothetical protein